MVWVGGFALALGGILLVRYSIEQGLFGPGLRIAAGAVLALVLVGLGELARRKENASDIDQMPRAHIPSILTAAGTTIAYADVWAAYEIYKFLSPAMAFLLLGLVALGTLAAALKHGPALGGLGLVGAYVTPLLVSTTQPSYWTLYVYLTVVTAAAYALARFRMWRWLAITAAVFSIALDVCRHERSASRIAACARLRDPGGLRARGRVPRARAGLRPGRDARQGRTGVLGRARRLPRRRLCAGDGDQSTPTRR